MCLSIYQIFKALRKEERSVMKAVSTRGVSCIDSAHFMMTFEIFF